MQKIERGRPIEQFKLPAELPHLDVDRQFVMTVFVVASGTCVPWGGSLRARESRVFAAGWTRVSTAPAPSVAVRLRSRVCTNLVT